MKSGEIQSGWHQYEAAEVCRAMAVDPARGLTRDEVSQRRNSAGPNSIEHQARRQLWLLFADQFRDFMVLVLIAAAVVSGLVGELIDTAAILAIIFINAGIGCVQQYRAEAAMAALRRMASTASRVLRDGETMEVDSAELVPGDIVMLDAGDVVTADMRLIEAHELAVDESVITGESMPVALSVMPLTTPDLPLADRYNMAYRGTLITRGRGVGIVVATGMATELGRIAGLLSAAGPSRTPLQRRLAVFGRRLAIAILIICAVIFLSGILRGEPLLLMLLTAISLAVAAIPEALPAVVTASLAFGARRMAQGHALVRRLPAVETLGSVTYICADKTGTLTQNRMSVGQLFAAGRSLDSLPSSDQTSGAWRLLGEALAQSHDAEIGEGGLTTGDPTEVALLVAAAAAGFDRPALQRARPRTNELPFDAERKRMTTIHRDGNHFIAFTKGAPEHVIPLCTTVMTDQGPAAPTAIIEEAAAELGGKGYRVLAIAYREWQSMPERAEPAEIESELCFIGLVALLDPPREGVAEAVAECRRAGITPVMITGDHPATAASIAVRVGISAPGDAVLTGAQLASMSAEELEREAPRVRVYARVSPEQKIDIVRALQARGEFVAMTGDGVNDAPALKTADIGVAMGLHGTDVAREASDMVLLDDNFATIVTAVREGRRIYDNIRKFVRYTMTSNAGELWTLFLPPFLGLPIPLLPIHILWINLVTDGLPGLALAAEPAESDCMNRPPRPPGESLFARGNWQRMIWVGLLIGGLCIAAQGISLSRGSSHWQTIVFTVLTFSQLANALAVRTEAQSLFQIGLFSNPALLGAIGLTVALQVAVIYSPLLQPVFKTQALTAGELGACVLPALIVLGVLEFDKFLQRRRHVAGHRSV